MTTKTLRNAIGGLAAGALFIALGLRIGDAREAVVDGARPVQAEIVSTSVERVVSHTAPDASRITWYPELEYRYRVDGETYTSEAIWPASERGGEEAWARRFIADYEAGDTVEANYQPDAPGKAYLIKSRPWLSWMAMAMGGVFIALGGVSLVRGLSQAGDASA